MLSGCTYILAPETIIKCKPDVHVNLELNIENDDGTFNLDTAHIIPGFSCNF